MAKKLPPRLIELLKDINLTEAQASWDCHGTRVVLHKALEKIAAHHKIVFDQPQIIACDVKAKEAVICVTGHMGEATEWSIGEAAPYNTNNSYPFAMAEKRAKDRVILKLVGLHGDVYSEAEADEFKRQEQMPKEPSINLQLTDKIDAAIAFYENCDAEKFEQGEKKYKSLINAVGLSEEDFNRVVEAHDKRRLELQI
jgi:hypothetical protein